MSDRLIDKTKGSPVNRTAGLVTSQSSVVFDATKHLPATCLHSEAPLPLRPVPTHIKGWVDLTGQQSGRLVVQGMFDHKAMGRRRNPKRGALWVVRCDCGRYEVRRRKALTNEANQEDRCEGCWKLAGLKRRADHFGGRAQKELWEY